MTRLRLLLRRLFVENIGTKLVSLLVALVLFYFVREGKQEVKKLSLPVKLIVPKGVVQTNEVARQVEVSLVGPKVNVDDVDEKSLGDLTVDLTAFGTGSSTYFFHKDLFTGLPADVQISSIRPSYIAVRLEKEVSRILPITPILKGQPRHGYRIDRYTLSETELALIGPTSLVDRTDFLPTAPIDIADATQTISRGVPIKLPAPSTRLANPRPVLVTVHIIEEIVQQEIKDIAVKIEGLKEANVEITPAKISITIKGALLEIEKIKPDQLGAWIKIDASPHRAKLVGVDRIEGLPSAAVRVGPLPQVTVSPIRNGPPSPRRGGRDLGVPQPTPQPGDSSP